MPLFWTVKVVALPPALDLDELERLVASAAGGDEAAWQALWQRMEPPLVAIVARPSFLARLSRREDDRLNIVVEVMARLRADGFRRLRMYVDERRTTPELRFLSWLRVVAKRVGIDYLRAHPDYVDRRRAADRGTAPGEWKDRRTLPPASQLPGERPPVTDRGVARELLGYAAEAMPAAQHTALTMWVVSESYPAIATALGLDSAGDAERVVRAAIERLRRRFRAEAS